MSDGLFPNFGRAYKPVNFGEILHPDRPKPVPAVKESLGSAIYAYEKDVVRVSGSGGSGKSFFLLELTARGYAGGLMLNAARILWVDEEGHDDILTERLRALGLTTEDLEERFRYFLNQGVRLDSEPHREGLFQAVEEFKPDVIVIDSNVRMYSLYDENDNGGMASLYNDGIKPLSRKYGATVFIIDHTIHGGARTRGASEKRDQTDRVWVIRATDTDAFTLTHDKARRGAAPPPKKIRRVMENHLLSHEADWR